jgi:ABC-type spermidine/putrescine transport system permease subunit II
MDTTLLHLRLGLTPEINALGAAILALAALALGLAAAMLHRHSSHAGRDRGKAG